MEIFDQQLSEVLRSIAIAEQHLSHAEATLSTPPSVAGYDEAAYAQLARQRSDAASSKLFWTAQMESRLAHQRELMSRMTGHTALESMDCPAPELATAELAIAV